jgi:hypothetical protein
MASFVSLILHLDSRLVRVSLMACYSPLLWPINPSSKRGEPPRFAIRVFRRIASIKIPLVRFSEDCVETSARGRRGRRIHILTS